MPTYRVEEASTGRAGCKNKECLDKKEKILKGELRLGSWVESESFQSWSWKHWGCVTPKQVASINDIVGGDDFSLLDGYDELSAENQEKIRDAVEHGHINDSDWKGDVEVNRPGKTGFRVRASKKKADADAKKTQDAKAEKPKGAKRGKKKPEEDDGDEPVSKKAKTTSKKRKTSETPPESEEGESEASEEKTKSRRKPSEQTSKPKPFKATESSKPKKSAASGAKKSEGTKRITRSQASAA